MITFALTWVRAVIMSVFNIIWTILISILVLSVALFGWQRAATNVIRVWASVVLGTFGIRVIVEGEENIPRTGGGIIVFNHQSHLDIPSLVAATAQQIRFGAKIELFSIPFFGPAMASIGTLKISRDNRTEVLRIYQEASKRFDEGILFVLAPEGTRQKEPRLGRFKKGPFIFAMNAKVPVVPAVLKGAYDVLPPKHLLINVGRFRRTIRLKFLPPVDTTKYSQETLDVLTTDTQAKMIAAFEAM